MAGRPFNQTGVQLETLNIVGECLLKVPKHFVLHPEIQKLIAARKKAMTTGKGVTMAFAESLAFGCLMSKYSPDALPGAIVMRYFTLPLCPTHHLPSPCLFLYNFDLSGLRALTKENRTLSSGLGAKKQALDVELHAHPTVHVRLSGQGIDTSILSINYQHT